MGPSTGSGTGEMGAVKPSVYKCTQVIPNFEFLISDKAVGY